MTTFSNQQIVLTEARNANFEHYCAMKNAELAGTYALNWTPTTTNLAHNVGMSLRKNGATPTPAWSPDQLAGVFGWWDASDTSTITHDAATSATQGLVSEIQNKLGLTGEMHFTQSTSANKLETGNTSQNVNGLNTLYSTGAPRLMVANIENHDMTRSHYHVVIARKDTQSSTGSSVRTVIAGAGQQLEFGTRIPSTSEKPFLWATGATIENATADWTVGDTDVFSVQRNYGTSASVHRGQSQIITTTQASIISGTFSQIVIFGDNVNTDRPFKGAFCESFIGFGALTAGDLTNITTYANAKWGTPAPV